MIQDVKFCLDLTVRALLFILLVSCIRDLVRQVISPRFLLRRGILGGPMPIRLLVLRWLSTAANSNIRVKTDFYWIIRAALQLTAVGVLLDLPRCNRALPTDIIFFVLWLTANLFQAVEAWSRGKINEWRYALAKLTFAPASVVIAWFCVEGMFLSSNSTHLCDLAREHVLLKTPFHILAFLLVSVVVFSHSLLATGQKISDFKEHTMDRISEICWAFFISTTFGGYWLSENWAYFFESVIKTVVFLICFEFVKIFLPILRIDRLEKIMLKWLIPTGFIVFFGLWWGW